MIGRRAALSNVTGAGGVSEWFEPVDISMGSLAVYIQSGPGVSAGAIQLEEASSANGVPIAVGTPITVPAANGASVYRPTLATGPWASNGPTVFGALRLRVTTAIVGGNVSAWIVAG